MPIFVWLEDIYYYSYHLYDYDEFIQLFLMDFFLINSEKINPTLGHVLDPEYISSRFGFDATAYKNYYPVRDLPSKVYFDIYFLDFAKSIYIETFLHAIIMFFLVKAFYKLLTKLLENKPKAILILSEFEGNTYKWYLWMVLLGENMLYLSFACGVQFRMFFSGIFPNKVNMSITAFCFFSLLIYCICYYQFTFNDHSKRIASHGLFLCKPTYKAFILESIMFASRNLLSGFIHGYFLDHHLIQLGLLIGVNGIVLLFIVRLKKEFQYESSYVLTFSYHLTFTLFNVSLLSQKKKFLFEEDLYKQLNFMLLLQLLLIIVLRTLSGIVIFLIEWKEGCKRVNKFYEK